MHKQSVSWQSVSWLYIYLWSCSLYLHVEWADEFVFRITIRDVVKPVASRAILRPGIVMVARPGRRRAIILRVQAVVAILDQHARLPSCSLAPGHDCE